MAHTQTISQEERVWDHLKFEGRRNQTPGRHLGYIYGRFNSQADADAWPAVKPDLVTPPFGVMASMLDQFFWDPAKNSGAGGYSMDDARVFSCLQYILTQPLTAAEYADTYGLQVARQRMQGAKFKVGGQTVFTVSELPEERASE